MGKYILIPLVLWFSTALGDLPPKCLYLSDYDGDGWGWENGQSCLISSSNEDVYKCIDDDGDGWGWDGSDSCIPPDITAQIYHSVIHAATETSSGQFYDKNIRVISDEATYKSELVKYSNNEPQLVDFSENRILLINMGSRPNTAYSVKVTSVTSIDQGVRVIVSYLVPTDSCPADDAITNPYLFLLIRTVDDIYVNEKLEVLCNVKK